MEPEQNHLISLLPPEDRLRLLASCETVPLVVGDVLCESGAEARHVYFPVNGFVSLLTRIEHHPSLEVGLIGREGALGAALALGVNTSPLQAMVQGPGAAWRISAADLRQQLACGGQLHGNLLHYVFVVLQQMSISAACLRFHLIGPRLARWLLMSADRVQDNQFHVTHELLAGMLGVRRVGITVAAGSLQRQGLIHYHRGELKVLDRSGLEAASCSCYARQRAAYSALLS